MWDAYHKYFHTYLEACRASYAARFGSAAPVRLPTTSPENAHNSAPNNIDNNDNIAAPTIQPAPVSGSGGGADVQVDAGAFVGADAGTGMAGAGAGAGAGVGSALGANVREGSVPLDYDPGTPTTQPLGVVTALKDALGLFVAFKRMWSGRDKVKVCAK
jgi:hypothetical protein